MKGILLAGGSGTRLYPLTTCMSKQLLPIYDKPTIYYPLCTLMSAGIRDILVISTPSDLPRIEALLGSGKRFGISLSYEVQAEPKGIAEAFIIGEKWINKQSVCLILGDNLFYGNQLDQELSKAVQLKQGGYIFAYHVEDPERYGVVEFEKSTSRAISIEEKPKNPKSHSVVTGLYFYDNQVCEIAKKLVPSNRGELEITDLNNYYLMKNELQVISLGRGVAWLDTGTPESLLSAAIFVHTLEKRQGLKIACPEEIAFNKKWITHEILKESAQMYKKSQYGDYLNQLLKTTF